MISQKAKKKIKEIKALKELNQEKIYTKFRTFYKKYKSFPRPITTMRPNPFKNNKNYKYHLYNNTQYNPLVNMMVTRTDLALSSYQTLTGNNNYININENKPKTFFGLDGNTPINNNTNYFNSTSPNNDPFLNTFNSTRPEYNSSNLNFLSLTNFNKYTYEDEEMASKALYNQHIKRINAKKKLYDKETKHLVYDKLGITDTLTDKESKKIYDQFKYDREEKKRNKSAKNYNDILKTAKDYSYKDPYISYKKMKVNNQLARKIEEIRNELVCQQYQEQYDSVQFRRVQTARMPPIKIVSKKKHIVKEDYTNAHIQRMFDEANLFDNNNNNNNDNDKLNLFDVYLGGEKLSRDEVLEKTKANIIYKGSNYHPPTRTQFGMTYDLLGRIFIFGGLGGKKLGDLWECSITNKFTWRKLFSSDDKTDLINEPYPRFGNTIHYYQEKLYNIGGSFIDWEINENSEGILCVYDLTYQNWNMFTPIDVIKKREEELKNNKTNSNFNFSILQSKSDTLTSSEIKSKKEKEENKLKSPILRRNHTSILVGTNIFLYGGISIEGKYLNDCWIYNLKNNTWSQLEFIGRMPPNLAYHCSCLALEKEQLENPHLSIYKVPMSQRKTVPLLKCDGIFFFGGMNDNRIPTNLFFVMKIGKKPVEFDIPKTFGKCPEPRISASMNFYPNLDLIVIHGGRNDKINIGFFNDFYVLDLETMNWIQPQFGGEIPFERSEHQSIVIGNRMIIFGGVSSGSLMNFDFEVMNLEFCYPEIQP